jgi:hypothetical protein
VNYLRRLSPIHMSCMTLPIGNAIRARNLIRLIIVFIIASERISALNALNQLCTNNFSFSDLPFPMFISYLVYSSFLTSNLLLLKDPNVKGRLTPEECWLFRFIQYEWKEVFLFLFDPRLQKSCFKESNKLSKHNLLTMWTIFLKFYCQKQKYDFCLPLDFHYYEPDITAKAATGINGDAACNFYGSIV